MKTSQVVEHIKKNNIDKIKLYLDEHFSHSNNNHYIFYAACAKGRTKMVRLLLDFPKMDNAYFSDNAFNVACYNKNIEVVKILLKDNRFNPANENNQPIIDTFYNLDLEMAKILLADKRVDPTVLDYFCFLQALKFGSFELLDLILQHESMSFLPYTLEDFENNTLTDSLIKLYEIPVLKKGILEIFKQEKDIIEIIRIKNTVNNF